MPEHSPEPPRQYYISINDQSEGPFPLEALREKLRLGEVSEESQVWGEGIDRWQPLWTALLVAPAPAAAPAPAGKSGRSLGLLSGFVGALLGICLMLALEKGGVVFLGRYTQAHFSEIVAQLSEVRREAIEQKEAYQKDRQQMIARVDALEAFLRNVKITRIVATRRAMENRNWDEVDRLLVELDQLARIVPDDESEVKVRDKLLAEVAEFRKTLSP